MMYLTHTNFRIPLYILPTNSQNIFKVLLCLEKLNDDT